MPLTDNFCKNVKPLEKGKRYFDSGGLYLEVTVKGKKYWRLKYRFDGKEKLLSLGVYPKITLKEARDKREEAKKLLLSGTDPSQQRKEEKLVEKLETSNSFKEIAIEWHSKQKPSWTEKHAKNVLKRLETDIFNEIGHFPINEIKTPVLLAILEKIESRGAIDIAKRARQTCGQIFRYAIAIGKAEYDITSGLKGALTTGKSKNYNCLNELELPEFFDKLEKYEGHIITKLAIKFTIHTFVRTVETRGAQWDEFNFKKNEWHIPADRMKMSRKHIVPLSDEVLAIISEIKIYSGDNKFLFPHSNNSQKFMSENTMLYALYRIGYHSRATMHGFRATASTILNERGFKSDVIEKQLAHAERNSVRASYNHAEYLSERRKMMTWWSDFLVGLNKR